MNETVHPTLKKILDDFSGASPDVVAAAQSKRTEADVRTERDDLRVAVEWRRIIWRQERDEARRLERLTEVCVRLKDGDAAKGRELATAAMWTPL